MSEVVKERERAVTSKRTRQDNIKMVKCSSDEDISCLKPSGHCELVILVTEKFLFFLYRIFYDVIGTCTMKRGVIEGMVNK
jgi:hypothetical protein